MVDLKKEISLDFLKGGQSGKDDYPTKTHINLVSPEAVRKSTTVEIALFVVFLVLFAIFVKFAIFDPIMGATASADRVAHAETQLQQLKASNGNYAELSEEYAHLVIPDLTDEERNLVDRDAVLDLLRTKVMGTANLSSVKVVGNTINATCIGVQLQDISTMVHNLESDPRVSHVTVSTAQSKDGHNATATIEIVMKGALDA